MKKICVIGSGGAGKSTFSRKLGDKLRLPVYHLDKMFWKPGWIEPEDHEFDMMLKELVLKPEWIMDGNFKRTMKIRFDEADTIIYLDFPRRKCLINIFKRYIKYRGKVRGDLPEGCPEKFDWEFTKWVWDYPKRSRPLTLEMLEKYRDCKNVVVLKSRKDIENYLELNV